MYLWLKAFHLLSVISWMAGLLYLPRLMVYHAESTAGSEQSETFKIMERRLLKAIMTPAMLLTWLFGLLLVWMNGLFELGVWFYLKLVLVVGLSALHMVLARHVRLFARDANSHGPVYFRILNEVPTLIMIAVVLLVVLKPF